MSGMARSQVDMSLDDIIKMQKEQKKNALAKSPTQTRRNKVRARVLAARPRIQKRIRVQNAVSPRGQAQTPMARGRRPRANLRAAPAVSSSVALAVLKRARRTAVEAAKAAAQAAALLHQSQSRRRDVFDANRNLQTRRSAPRNDSRLGFSPRKSRMQNRNINAQNPRTEARRLKQARRRQRPVAIAAASVGTQRFQGGQPAPYNQFAGAATKPHFTGNRRRPRQRPALRQGDRQYYTNHGQNAYTAADQAREREYLAQARALIRAQSEQSRQIYNPAQSNVGQYNGPLRNRRGRQGYRPRY